MWCDQQLLSASHPHGLQQICKFTRLGQHMVTRGLALQGQSAVLPVSL